MIKKLFLRTRELHFFVRYPFAKQFIKFTFVGFFVTFIDFTIYFTLTRLFYWWEEHFLYANGVAFITALSVSFFINKLWTFRNDHPSYKKQYTKFFISNVVALTISQSVLYLLVSVIELSDIIAKPTAVSMTVLFNFVSYKFWIFKRRS